MAAKKSVSSSALAKLAGDYMLVKPDIQEDGSVKTPRWETGIKALDVLTGGGFPKSKIVAFGSEEGVGKTTILLHSAVNIIEKYNKKVVYLDVEGGVTYDMMEGIGVLPYLYSEDNPDGLFFYMDVESIQEVNTIIKVATSDNDVALIVLDSDTNVIDETTLELDDLGASKNPVGESARMWSANFKKINALIKRSEACLVVIHQARNDLSGFHVVMKPSGGKAAKHVASIEIWGVRKEFVGEGDVTKDKQGQKIKKSEAIGAKVQLTTLKNRLGYPYRTVDAFVYFGKGVSNKWAYREWLETHEITDPITGEVRPILKSGAWPNLRLPSGEYKDRGNEGTWKLIEEHWDEIVEYVNSNGGFTASINSEIADEVAE